MSVTKTKLISQRYIEGCHTLRMFRTVHDSFKSLKILESLKFLKL